MTLLTLTPRDIALWGAQGQPRALLPDATLIGLLELPIGFYGKRATHRQGHRFPDEMTIRWYARPLPTEQMAMFRIESSSVLGPPDAFDMEFFMAILWMFAEQGWRSNVLSGINLGLLVERTGRPDTTIYRRLARAALERLAHVRVAGSLVPLTISNEEQRTVFEALRSTPLDDAADASPSETSVMGEHLLAHTSNLPIPWQKRVDHLLTQRAGRHGVRALLGREPKGFVSHLLTVDYSGDRLTRVSLADKWMLPPDAPAGWFDFPAFFALRTPLAQRMLQLLSANVGDTGDWAWSVDLQTARVQLGLPATIRPDKLLVRIRGGAHELAEQGLIDATAPLFSPADAPTQLYLEAGHALLATINLRGLKPKVSFELRSQFAALCSLGFTVSESARLLETYPDTISEALLYLFWRRSDDQSAHRNKDGTPRKPIDSPKAYFAAMLEKPLDRTEPGFLRWRSALEREARDVFLQGGVVGAPGGIRRTPATDLPPAVGFDQLPSSGGAQSEPPRIALPNPTPEHPRHHGPAIPPWEEALAAWASLPIETTFTHARRTAGYFDRCASDGGVVAGEWTIRIHDTILLRMVDKPERRHELVASLHDLLPHLNYITSIRFASGTAAP